MTASRMILQSISVLAARLVGFVMGRWDSRPAATPHNGQLQGDQPSDGSGREVSASGALFGSLPVMAESEGTSMTGARQQQGPNRQFFPEALHGENQPERLSGTDVGDPIRNSETAATAAQIEFLIEEELPSASDSDKRLWAEELEGLSLQSAREILQLKQSLNSLERPTEPSETNRSHDDDRTRGN